ncbi:MAG: alpha-amylase family glycosyl hydrolase, partial [Culicoidibacterales bacterium]
NPKVREEVWNLINFWLEKGIGGFRMDVIDLIGKVPDEKITGNGPKLHEYLQEMNQKSFGNYDVLTVGETWGATPEIAKLYSNPERNELSMVFQFEHISLDEQPGKAKWDLRPLQLTELKTVFNKWQTELDGQGWNSLFWNNHDLPRIVSRWGNDKAYRVESAKMLATLLHGMQGTPYIFQGEEIGMTNVRFATIEEYDDIETRNMYNERIEQGYSHEEIMESIYVKGRDNARTPMQWSNAAHGGFTQGTPWLTVNPNYTEINVEQALADPTSVFYHYQRLIALRKANPTIIYGTFTMLDFGNEAVFAYIREYEGDTILVVCNFTSETATFNFEAASEYGNGDILLANYTTAPTLASNMELRPYEAVMYRLSADGGATTK